MGDVGWQASEESVGTYAEIFETRGAITKKSLYDGRWQANWDPEDGKLRLFDKSIDWPETRDVALQHDAVTQRFKARIAGRTWRRASVGFQEYARSRDVRSFAPHLGAIQQQAMLDAVLEIFAREPELPNELRSPLERVLSRSILEETQRAWVQQLLQRIPTGSGRLSQRLP